MTATFKFQVHNSVPPASTSNTRTGPSTIHQPLDLELNQYLVGSRRLHIVWEPTPGLEPRRRKRPVLVRGKKAHARAYHRVRIRRGQSGFHLPFTVVSIQSNYTQLAPSGTRWTSVNRPQDQIISSRPLSLVVVIVRQIRSRWAKINRLGTSLLWEYTIQMCPIPGSMHYNMTSIFPAPLSLTRS